MIRLIITGNIGGDAEVRHLENGRSAISFSLAHTEKWKAANGEQQERTTWVRCTLWRKSDQVTIAQYLKKGTRVMVEGTPAARAWTDKEGKPQASLELTVQDLEFQGSARPQQGTTTAGTQTSNQAPATTTIQQGAPILSSTPFEDDLPF